MCSNEENLPLLGGKDGSDITMNTKQLEHVSISASRSSRKRLLRSAAVPSKILPQSSPNLIKACLLLVCVSIISVLIHYQQHYQQNRSHSIRDPFTPSAPAQKLTRLEQLLHHWPVVDTHNDFPGKIRWFLGKLSAKNITQLGPEFNTDIVRLKKGGIGGQFWSAFVPCSSDFHLQTENVQQTLAQIDLIKLIPKAYSSHFEFATKASDINTIWQSSKRVASFIGVEGGHSIDASLSVLRMFYDVGVRYLTLTHTCHTAWADSCGPQAPIHNGLTEFGVGVIKEMNRLGMLVDLSHVSHQSMRQAINVSLAPVIFSHSSAYSLCKTPRNVPDDVIESLMEKDGVVMINFWANLIACGRNATLSQVADHVDHVVKIADWKHVGFGSDFDGIDTIPVGLEDVSKYPELIKELMNRGYTDEQLQGIMGQNFVRVLTKVEEVRDRLSAVVPDETVLEVEKKCKVEL